MGLDMAGAIRQTGNSTPIHSIQLSERASESQRVDRLGENTEERNPFYGDPIWRNLSE